MNFEGVGLMMMKLSYDGEQEAKLIVLCCSQTPGGRKGWTLKLLNENLVTLQIVDNISRSTVNRALKKTNLSRG